MTTTAERIAELTAAWEEGANYGESEPTVRASDYALTEDDYRAYLSDDEAAEIVALTEQQAENQERAERIAERASKDAAEDVLTIYAWDVPEDWAGLVVIVKQAARRAATAAALAALTEMENRA